MVITMVITCLSWDMKLTSYGYTAGHSLVELHPESGWHQHVSTVKYHQVEGVISSFQKKRYTKQTN
jgi:hypothetical protein